MDEGGKNNHHERGKENFSTLFTPMEDKGGIDEGGKKLTLVFFSLG